MGSLQGSDAAFQPARRAHAACAGGRVHAAMHVIKRCMWSPCQCMLFSKAGRRTTL